MSRLSERRFSWRTVGPLAAVLALLVVVDGWIAWRAFFTWPMWRYQPVCDISRAGANEFNVKLEGRLSGEFVEQFGAEFADTGPHSKGAGQRGRVAVSGREVYVAPVILWRGLAPRDFYFFGAEVFHFGLDAQAAGAETTLLDRRLAEGVDVAAYFGVGDANVVRKRLLANECAFKREFILQDGEFARPCRR